MLCSTDLDTAALQYADIVGTEDDGLVDDVAAQIVQVDMQRLYKNVLRKQTVHF